MCLSEIQCYLALETCRCQAVLALWSREDQAESEAAPEENQTSGFKQVGVLYGFLLNNCTRDGAAPGVELGVKFQVYHNMELLCCCELSKNLVSWLLLVVWETSQCYIYISETLLWIFFRCWARKCSINYNLKYQVCCVVCTSSGKKCPRGYRCEQESKLQVYSASLTCNHWINQVGKGL